MAAPRLPQTRNVLGVFLIAGVIVGFWGIYYASSASPVFQGFGLILDIIGALLLAVPDLPIIQGYLFSGKLAKGRENIAWENRPFDASELFRGTALKAPSTSKILLDGLDVAPHGHGSDNTTIKEYVEENGPFGGTEFYEEGFYEIKEVLKEKYSKEVSYWNDPDRYQNVEWDRIYGFKIRESSGELYFDALKNVDGEPILEISEQAENIFIVLDEYLDYCNSKFRRTGLMILILGFSFQYFSLIM